MKKFLFTISLAFTLTQNIAIAFNKTEAAGELFPEDVVPMDAEEEIEVLSPFEAILEAVITDDSDQVLFLLQNPALIHFLNHNQDHIDTLHVNAADANIIELFIELGLIASPQALELMAALWEAEAMSPPEARSNPYPEYPEEQRHCFDMARDGAEMARLTAGMRGADLNCPEPRRF